MINKKIKFLTFSAAAFLAVSNFALAEEETLDNLPGQTSPGAAIEENLAPPTASDIKSKLDLLEKIAPVILRLDETAKLISGLETRVRADIGIFSQTNTGNLDFKWTLKKNGLNQSIAALSQGRGRSQLIFTPSSSGNYEVTVEVTDEQGNVRVSQPLLFGIGDNLLVTFNPLKPVNGQIVTANVSGFNNGAGYKWFLDGQEQATSGPRFDFLVSKSFGQAHKVTVSAVNKEGIVSAKEVLVPVYRPEVTLTPAIDGTGIAGQAGRSSEFLIKGNGPIVLNAGTPSFIDADSARYTWYLNGVKIDEGIGKKSIRIDSENEILKQSQADGYKASVLVTSPDSRHIAEGSVRMDRVNPSSSLAAVNPEKMSSPPLLAESKSFFTSLGTVRKIILPLMIVMFAVVMAIGNTQPQKIE